MMTLALPRPARAYASATAAAESIVPAGWRLVLTRKPNGHWSALCTCGPTWTEATSKDKAVAIGTAALKAVRAKTGKS